MPATRITIHLDDSAGDSPRGSVMDERTGDSRRFLGWLGLVAALDALISNGGGSNATPHAESRQVLR